MSQVNEAIDTVWDRLNEISDYIDVGDFDSALDLMQNLIDEAESLRAELREEVHS